MRLMTINTGSSSVRLALYAHDGAALRRLAGQQYPGDAHPHASLSALRGWEQVDAVVHRVVHGGVRLAVPCRIDAGVEAEIERLATLAPLHNPRSLAWIRACRALRGLAGDGDMRALLAADGADARRAIELYCYRARKYLGAYLAVLGGADAILFGGGVGEHAASVRGQILAGLEWAGIHLDAAANAATEAGERRISAPDSRVDIWIVPVDEEAVLADAVVQLLARGATPQPERRTI